MARARGDNKTLDLLSWKAERTNIERFPQEAVRAATIAAKISRAISQILTDAKNRETNPIDRAAVAQLMGEFLGEDVSKNDLDAYASQARDGHSITLNRAVALMHASLVRLLFP